MLLLAGFVGKGSAAFLYTVALCVYLRFFEPQRATVGSGDVQDVFEALTYRQRYEEARQRMVRDALTGLYNRGYFDEVAAAGGGSRDPLPGAAQPAAGRHRPFQDHQRHGTATSPATACCAWSPRR